MLRRMVYMRTVSHTTPQTQGYAMTSVYHSSRAGTTDGRQNEPPRLLDRPRFALRAKHYAYRTEQAYVHWTRRLILPHGKRHPQEMGGPKIEAFLTLLAVAGHVSASAQTQALCAILFLYKHVLRIDLPHLNAVRAKRPKRLPVVLSRDEMRHLLNAIEGSHGVYRLMPGLMYGSVPRASGKSPRAETRGLGVGRAE